MDIFKQTYIDLYQISRDHVPSSMLPKNYDGWKKKNVKSKRKFISSKRIIS